MLRKKNAFGCAVVLLFLNFSASAVIISGVVTDSQYKTPVFQAQVGTDSLHYVLTDSNGNFSFNTDSIYTGIRIAPTHQRQQASWNLTRGVFSWSGNAGEVSIQITNLRGVVVARFSSEARTGDEKLLRRNLPAGEYIARVMINGQNSVYKAVNASGGLSASTHAIALGNDGMAVAGMMSLGIAAGSTTVLTFQKTTYYTVTKTYTGSQSNVALKLLQNHTLSRHPFLYAGEWQNNSFNNQKMYIVQGGVTTWTYTDNDAGGAEYDDAWLCSNGNIAFSRKLGSSGMVKATQPGWEFSQPDQECGHSYYAAAWA